ncbi:MAG: hypothetical protein K6C40_03560 [Thermoguttaceae bacterium]|nr:hypothetical protein [Thermoguttaceae bacterium]
MNTQHPTRPKKILNPDMQHERTRMILDKFSDVSGKVSDKVLYELLAHFIKRQKDQRDRQIVVKGNRIPIQLVPLPAFPPEIVEEVCETIKNRLQFRFAKLPTLGRCWLDPRLQDIPLPTNMRTVSDSLETLIRGTHMPLENPNAKVIRFYVHWKDPKGNIDLDLSATFLGKKDLTDKDDYEILSWCTEYKCDFACHSGDVRHRVGDCAEYVDVVIDEARKRFNYVVLDVRNYDRRTLREVRPVFGYMEREAPESSLIWVPQTVKNSFVITTESSNALIVAFDLHKMKYVVLDLDMNGTPVAAENIKGMKQMVQAYMEPPVVSVYDLLSLHVEARGGEFVPDEEKESADTQFRFEDFSTSYVKILKWMRC